MTMPWPRHPHALTERPPATNALLAVLTRRFRLGRESLHGPEHWLRVLRNGRMLAPKTGADAEVVDLFALLHDVERRNEHHDPEHGPRAAELAGQMQGLWFDLAPDRLALLQYACRLHDRGETRADVTVQTCWDADRLDLGRVGIIPDPDRLCTEASRGVDVIAAALARSRRAGAAKLAEWPGTEDPLAHVTLEMIDASLRGDVQAAYDMGHQLSFRADDHDARQALGSFAKAARAGHGRAQWRYGRMRADGLGGEADLTAAVGAFRDAVQAGVPEALNSLGLHLVMGWGTEPDLGQGLALIREAAQAGQPRAHFNLARFHQDGVHLKSDPARALTHLRAALPMPEAAFNLAVTLSENDGGRDDAAEIEGALTGAARFGFAPAQYSLAVLYHNGDLLAPDDRKFWFWLDQAARQGHPPAQKLLRALSDPSWTPEPGNEPPAPRDPDAPER